MNRAELLAALKPFADMGNHCAGEPDETILYVHQCLMADLPLRIGHLRAAHKAFTALTANPSPDNALRESLERLADLAGTFSVSGVYFDEPCFPEHQAALKAAEEALLACDARAALSASAGGGIEEAVAAEREACAAIADVEIAERRADQKNDLMSNFIRGQLNTALRMADYIRARSLPQAPRS